MTELRESPLDLDVVVIDNYDSYTYNLVQAIACRVERPPLVVRNDEYRWEELERERLDCVVVSPAYRLSREAPYPAALDDCYDALLWMRDEAGSLGVRPDRFAVGGCSAGGGLTAAVSLLARDRGDVRLAFQLPIYPMLDDRGTTPSAVGNDAPVWDSRTNDSAWRLYLGDLYGSDDVPYTAAPSRAEDLSGLPPTLVSVGAIDGFFDEDVDYAQRLTDAGVPVDIRVYAGACHAFQMAVDARRSWRPTSRTWEFPPRTAGMTSASQHRRRAADAESCSPVSVRARPERSRSFW